MKTVRDQNWTDEKMYSKRFVIFKSFPNLVFSCFSFAENFYLVIKHFGHIIFDIKVWMNGKNLILKLEVNQLRDCPRRKYIQYSTCFMIFRLRHKSTFFWIKIHNQIVSKNEKFKNSFYSNVPCNFTIFILTWKKLSWRWGIELDKSRFEKNI